MKVLPLKRWQNYVTKWRQRRKQQKIGRIVLHLHGRFQVYLECKKDIKLQEELTNTENKISYSRQLYNSVVSNYNVKLETFPSNIIAGMFGFKAADFLQTPEEEKAVPKVDFSGLGD